MMILFTLTTPVIETYREFIVLLEHMYREIIMVLGNMYAEIANALFSLCF